MKDEYKQHKPFKNIVGKGKNAGNQHFLLFPTLFPTLPQTIFNFPVTFILSSASAFNLDQSKNLLFGKGLTSLTILFNQPFENIMRQGENAENQHFLLFPTMCSTLSKAKITTLANSILSSANVSDSDQSKNCFVW